MPGMEGVLFTSLDVAIFPINEIFEYPLKMKNILILVIIHVISRIKLYIDQYHEKWYTLDILMPTRTAVELNYTLWNPYFDLTS